MMRYLAGLFILFFSFVGISAAQHSHGGYAHGGGGHEAHGPAPFHPEGHGVRPSNGDHFRGNGGHVTAYRDRLHFDGRHFDAFYHGRFFGNNHRFYIGRPVFYGGYYRFWYGGFWFNMYDIWPSDWCYCDEVYIDYDSGTDCYFMYDPYHPGFRVRLGVVF